MATVEFFGGAVLTGAATFNGHFCSAASDAFKAYMTTDHFHSIANTIVEVINNEALGQVRADYPFDSPMRGHTNVTLAGAYVTTDWDGSADLGNALRADVELTTTVRWFKAAEGPTAILAAFRLVNTLAHQTGALAKLTYKSTKTAASADFDWPCFFANGGPEGPVMDVNVAPVVINPVEDSSLKVAVGVVTLRWDHFAEIGAT